MPPILIRTGPASQPASQGEPRPQLPTIFLIGIHLLLLLPFLIFTFIATVLIQEIMLS